jgi:hypothetical protein
MKYTLMLLAFLAGLVLAYLFGAFTANSFNIGDWSTDGRLVTAMMGVVVGGFAVMLTEHEYVHRR